MKRQRPLFLFALGVALVVLAGTGPLSSGAAQAQDSNEPVSIQSSNGQQQTLNDLGAAFKWIDWDSKAHGVLLAIAPDKVSGETPDDIPPDDGENTVPDDDATKPLFTPTGRYGLNAGLVARHFKRKLVRLPTMAVFAPPTMITLSRDLKPINPFAGMDIEEKMRRLEASLTAAQWKALGSESGLGMGDLNKEQQPLFEALIPEDGELRKAKVASSDGYFYSDPGNNPAIPVSDAQRQGLHIRLERIANFNLVTTKGQQDYQPAFHADPEGKEKLMLIGKPDSFAKASSVYGQQIRFKTTNKLKPSDLDLKSPSLNVWVTIEKPVKDAATNPEANPAPAATNYIATTVGDLIAATRKATGIDIYVDGRLAKLPAVVKGGETPMVRAADLLEALCWALTATYRQVGPTQADPKAVAYILTYDHEGLAVRRGLMGEWGQIGTAIRSVTEQNFDKSIQKQNPAQYLSFANGNLLNPTPEAQKAYQDFVFKQGEYFPTVPVSTLTSAQQAQLKEEVGRIAKEHEQNPNNGRDEMRTDRVAMQLNLTMVLIVPDIGELEIGDTWSDNTAPPRNGSVRPTTAMEKPKVKPVHGAKVILAVAPPRNREAANALVETAVAHGISQIWVHLTESDTSGLADCIAAGKAHHVPVGAILGLMRAPAGSLPPAADNVNLYGETGPQWSAHVAQFVEDMQHSPFGQVAAVKPLDILDPADAGWEKRIQERAAEIAAIPGLSGLALCDATAPGYHGSKNAVFSSLVGDSFGYTPANRLAFLKQSGYDPIDISAVNYYDGGVREKTSLPFFDTDGGDVQQYQSPSEDYEVGTKWQDFRADQETAALKTLRSSLLKEHPALPVYLCPTGSSDGMNWGSAYRLWDKPDTLPLDSVYTQDILKQSAPLHGAYYAFAYSHADFDAVVKRIPSYATMYTEPILLSLWLSSMLEPDPRLKTQSRTPQLDGAVLDLSAYSPDETLTMVKTLILPVTAN